MNLSQVEYTSDHELLDKKSWDYYWLGLFQPDGNLRDNFLMFIGESHDLNSDLYQALTCLGEIKHENLTHCGCQILATDSNGKIHSLASVKPFKPGDIFSLVDSLEHKKLVGEKEHYEEIRAISRLKDEAEAMRQENEQYLEEMKTRLAEEEARYHENTFIPAPPLDMFLDMDDSPDWLKEYIADQFGTMDLYYIATAIGLLARVGTEANRGRASRWAGDLNDYQISVLDRNLSSAFMYIMDHAPSAPRVCETESRLLADSATSFLAKRDECASLIWILEHAKPGFCYDPKMIDDMLQKQTWLFEHRRAEGMQLDLLRMVRERCPDCWWAVRAKLD
ncbi:MAG: hypothetical protein ACOYUZ_01405 [Patescibacteria group bacterium]